MEYAAIAVEMHNINNGISDFIKHIKNDDVVDPCIMFFRLHRLSERELSGST